MDTTAVSMDLTVVQEEEAQQIIQDLAVLKAPLIVQQSIVCWMS